MLAYVLQAARRSPGYAGNLTLGVPFPGRRSGSSPPPQSGSSLTGELNLFPATHERSQYFGHDYVTALCLEILNNANKRPL